MDTLSSQAQQNLVTIVCAQPFQSRCLTRQPVDVRLCLSGYENHVLFAVGGQWVWAHPWSIAERTVLRRFVEQDWNMLLVQRRSSMDDAFLEPHIVHRSIRLVDWPMVRIECIAWDYETLPRMYPTMQTHYENRMRLLSTMTNKTRPLSCMLYNAWTHDLLEHGVTLGWALPQLTKPSPYVLKPGSMDGKRGRDGTPFAKKTKFALSKSKNYAEKIYEVLAEARSAGLCSTEPTEPYFHSDQQSTS